MSSFSDIEVSVVSGWSSLFSFNSLLFPGINGDKALDFIYFFFFGIRFSGATLTRVPTVKPVYPVVEDKEDAEEAVSLWCLCTSISSRVGASDWEIMFGLCF